MDLGTISARDAGVKVDDVVTLPPRWHPILRWRVRRVADSVLDRCELVITAEG